MFVFAAPNNASTLKQINHRISSTQKSIHTYQSKKQAIQQHLKSTETQIGELVKHISVTKKQIGTQQKKLNQTNKKYQLLSMQLNDQKKILAEQIRSVYALGRQPYLKILLNQKDTARMARYLEYFRYMNQARLRVIVVINETAKKIKQTADEMRRQTDALSASKTIEPIGKHDLSLKNSTNGRA